MTLDFDLGLDKVKCDWCGRMTSDFIISFDNRRLCKTEAKECLTIGTKMSHSVALSRPVAQLTPQKCEA